MLYYLLLIPLTIKRENVFPYYCLINEYRLFLSTEWIVTLGEEISSCARVSLRGSIPVYGCGIDHVGEHTLLEKVE